jgi:hypothetical protein
MTYQFFYRSENSHRAWKEWRKRPAYHLELSLRAGLSFEELIREARAAGMPSGSGRAGCFEIQADDGIWQHRSPEVRERGYGKLLPSTAIFRTWEQIEEDSQE